jgi:hypothetical protein
MGIGIYEAPKQGDRDGSGDQPCIAARSAEGLCNVSRRGKGMIL